MRQIVSNAFLDSGRESRFFPDDLFARVGRIHIINFGSLHSSVGWHRPAADKMLIVTSGSVIVSVVDPSQCRGSVGHGHYLEPFSAVIVEPTEAFAIRAEEAISQVVIWTLASETTEERWPLETWIVASTR